MVLCCRLVDGNRIVLKVWKIEIFQDLSAIRMGIRAHATISLWSKRGKFGNQMPMLVEQLFWFITAQPLLEDSKMLWIPFHIRDWYLVRAERAFDSETINLCRPG